MTLPRIYLSTAEQWDRPDARWTLRAEAPGSDARLLASSDVWSPGAWVGAARTLLHVALGREGVPAPFALALPRLGRWSHAAGSWLVWRRIYWRGRWTPLCRVSRRYSPPVEPAPPAEPA